MRRLIARRPILVTVAAIAVGLALSSRPLPDSSRKDDPPAAANLQENRTSGFELRLESSPILPMPHEFKVPDVMSIPSRDARRADPSSFDVLGVQDSRFAPTNNNCDKKREEILNSIQLSREDVLKERGDEYRYNTKAYGITLAPEAVHVSTPIEAVNLGRPRLSYSLGEIRIGETIVARGASVKPEVRLEDRTVFYNRGSVEERYILKKDSLEQDFLIKELPSGRGVITVTGTLSTNLTPPAEAGSHSRISFTHLDKELLYVSDAVAIDGAGRRLPLLLAYADSKLSITVPAEWVADATLPILIDPVIGGHISVDGTTTSTPFAPPPRVTHNPNQNEWLVVWDDDSGASGEEVLGIRVTSAGELVGFPTVIGAVAGDDEQPAVSYAPNVGRYLVAWTQWTGGGSNFFKLVGRVLNNDLTPYNGQGQFTITDDTAGGDFTASIAYDGTKWYVVSEVRPESGNNYNIRGRFVNTNGTLGSVANPDTATDVAQFAEVAFENGVYMIVWKKGVVGGQWGLSARKMNTSGTFLTPITTIQSQIGVGGKDVSGGGTKFLIHWSLAGSPNTVKGRIANANTSNPMTFSTSVFTIDTLSTSYMAMASAYSSTLSKWCVVMTRPNGAGDIVLRRITSTGTVEALELVTNDSSTFFVDDLPDVAWNSVNNTLLIVNTVGTASPWKIEAHRFGLIPIPPVPTGLAASGVNAGVNLSWTASAGAASYNIKRSLVSGGPYEVVGNSATTGFLDTGLYNGGTYYYVVSALNDGGESANSSQVSAIPAAPGTQPIAILSRLLPTKTSPTDTALNNRLVSLGYTVEYILGSAITPASAAGRALVVLGATDDLTVGTRMRDSTVPVLCLNKDLVEGFGMIASGTSGTSGNGDAIYITDPDHFMAGGFPTGVVYVHTNSLAPMCRFVVSTGANIVAQMTVPDGQGMIFAHEAGSTMFGLNAPARRAKFLEHNAGLTANGLLLFDAAVRWIAGVPAAPVFTILVANGTVTLHWNVVEGALSYTVKRATSPTGPWTVIASGLSDASFIDPTGNSTHYYLVTSVNNAGEGVPAQAQNQGSPAINQYGVMAIEGPPVLKRRPVGSPVTPYDHGIYKMTIMKRLPNGDIVNLAPTDSVVVGGWELTALPGNPVSAVKGVQNDTERSIEIHTNDKAGYMKLKFIGAIVPQTGPIDYLEWSTTIQIHHKFTVRILLRFPEFDNPLDGRRPSIPGFPNLYDDDEGLMSDERLALAHYYEDGVKGFWQQAGIDLYVLADADRTHWSQRIPPESFIGNAFDAATYDAATDLPVATTHLLDLSRKHSIPNYLNFWFFQHVQVGNNPYNTDGIVPSPLMRGLDKTTVACDQEISLSTFAHELGHCLGLPDLTVNPFTDRYVNTGGILNNEIFIYPMNTVKARNLMYSDNRGWDFLYQSQTSKARFTLWKDLGSLFIEMIDPPNPP